MAREIVQLAKEQQHVNRQVLKKRKEREEGCLAKVVVQEEPAHMKELQAAEQVALWASRQALHDKVQRIFAEHLAATMAAKTAKAIEKARKMVER